MRSAKYASPTLPSEYSRVGTGAVDSDGDSGRGSDPVDFIKQTDGFHIPYASLTFDPNAPLKSGHFGTVFRAQWRPTRGACFEVAVKTLKTVSQETQSAFQTEVNHWVAISSQQQHLNIVSLYGVCIDTSPYCMVLAYMPGGTLSEHLSRHSEDDWDKHWYQRATFALEVIAGLTYLHTLEKPNNSIIHGDIKSDNVLIDGQGHARLTDFGLSVNLGDTSQADSFPLPWMPPELLAAFADAKRPDFDVASDTYSFGMLLWEMAIKGAHQPFREMDPSSVITYIVNGGQENIPAYTPAPIQSVIQKCWSYQPKDRPPLSEIAREMRAYQAEMKQEDSHKQRAITASDRKMIASLNSQITRQAGQAKANRRQCQQLTKRIETTCSVLLEGIDEIRICSPIEQTIVELKDCLQSSLRLITQFSTAKWHRYILKSGLHKGQFAQLNSELLSISERLMLVVAVQQLKNYDDMQNAQITDQQTLREQCQTVIALQQEEVKQLEQLSHDSSERECVLQQQLQSIETRLDNLVRAKRNDALLVPSHLEIPLYALQLFEVMSRDIYEVVYKGRCDAQTVMVKQVHGHLDKAGLSDFIRELTITNRLHHTCILQLYGASLSANRAYLVMEYCAKGKLFDYLKDEVLTLSEKHRLAQDIAQGLSFLHGKRVLHRDLNSASIFVDQSKHAKIANFRLAKIPTSSIQTAATSSQATAWLAPELFKIGGQYTDKADVYSYGVILWEIFSQKQPCGVIEKDDFPRDMPAVHASILHACCQADPNRRPTISVVVERLASFSLSHETDKNASPKYLYAQAVKQEQDRHYEQAFPLYLAAAEKGYARAQTNVATFFRKGIGGVEQDKKAAYRWLLCAARQGHKRGQYNTAVMLMRGDGVSMDIIAAMDWYEQAQPYSDANQRYEQLRNVLHQGYDSCLQSERSPTLSSQSAALFGAPSFKTTDSDRYRTKRVDIEGASDLTQLETNPGSPSGSMKKTSSNPHLQTLKARRQELEKKLKLLREQSSEHPNQPLIGRIQHMSVNAFSLFRQQIKESDGLEHVYAELVKTCAGDSSLS